MTRVALLRDFPEDLRSSMERYADRLAASLPGEGVGKYQVSEYKPRLGYIARNLPQLANMRMRYARYIDYPAQAEDLDSDIYHILDHGYSHLLKVLEPEKTIITVHDTIPLLAGRGLIPGVTLRRNWLAEYSSSYLKRARKIIADSESTKRDIVRYCGCEPGNVEVIYPGLGNDFRNTGEVKGVLRKELGLPGDEVRLVLISGGQFYKNHTSSLQVMQLLQQKYGGGIGLVRLGQSSPVWQRSFAMCGYSGEVRQLTNLTDDQVIRLYNAVDCLLFPSWYEGFGWPPLEAMACGTPAVTSNRASLPEVVGETGPVFEADDVEGMAAAVEMLLFDADYRAAQIARGLQQAAKFSWGNTARQLLRVYDTLH